jgi:predicted peroxiredoxin
MSDEPEKILIVFTSGPDTPARCAAPFFFATGAAAMGYDVSMFFTMQATQLLKLGVAERPISEFIRSALDADVKFFVCSASLELNDMSPDDLIEDVDNLVGSVFLTERGLESDLVLSF